MLSFLNDGIFECHLCKLKAPLENRSIDSCFKFLSSVRFVTLILNHQHKYHSGFVGQLLGRGGARTAATSKMERFVIIVNGFQPLTIVTKRSILDVAAVLDPPLIVASTDLLISTMIRLTQTLVC